MQWFRIQSDPITTERRARVVNVDNGIEGYRDIKWSHGTPVFYGPVYETDLVLIEIQDEGTEFEWPIWEEQNYRVLDTDPIVI